MRELCLCEADDYNGPCPRHSDLVFRSADPHGLKSGEGRKDDAGKKARPGLLPPRATLCVSEVLGVGAQKYLDNNWVKVPGARRRYRDALLRHLLLWMAGEDRDAETGLPHLAHAICCGLFLLEFEVGGLIEVPEPPRAAEGGA